MREGFFHSIVVSSTVQVAIAQINEQIGAAGVVNQECKQVVAGYGLQIAGLLEAQVVRETD